MSLDRSVELRLIGGFSLSLADNQLSIPPRAERLIAFLALREGGDRDLVASRLWPDQDDEQARSCLRSTLWRLPKPGGLPLVCGSSDRLLLEGHVVVDVRQLRSHLDRWPAGTAPSVQLDSRALTDDLLPVWYDDWLVIERERQRQIRLHALERLSEWFVSSGRFDEAIETALQAIDGDPLRESAHRCLVRAHLAEGNVSEARRELRTYVGLLADAGIPTRLSPQMHEITMTSRSWALFG
jgi:DNA-binding SARP family transcriptional activator